MARQLSDTGLLILNNVDENYDDYVIPDLGHV